MPRLGSKLRIKRLALGLSLKDVSRKTKIKQKELDALEEEEVLKFKDKETALEHVKAYSAVLGLDRTELLADFEDLWSDSSTANAYMQQQHKRENRFAAFREQKLLSYGAIVAVTAIFLSVGGYMFWNNFFDSDDPEHYYATTAGDVSSEETAVNGPETSDAQDVPLSQEETTDDDQNDIGFVADAEDDDAVDRVNEDDEDVPEDPVLEEDPEEEDEQVPAYAEEGLPQTGGLAYMIWFGLLTFIIGLVLFLPALWFKKDYDPVLGPPY